MNPVSIDQVTIILLSGAISWIIDDLLANLFLAKHEKGAMVRFIGARWLKRKTAIQVAILQFAVAFVASFFVQDFLILFMLKLHFTLYRYF